MHFSIYSSIVTQPSFDIVIMHFWPKRLCVFEMFKQEANTEGECWQNGYCNTHIQSVTLSSAKKSISLNESNNRVGSEKGNSDTPQR